MKRLFPERNPNHIRDQQGLFAWLMSAPALILIIAFFLIPFFMSVYYSFTDKMLASPPGTTVQFKGLDNYIKLFQSDAVKNAFINTTKYVLIVVPFIMILATLLAIFVNQKLRGDWHIPNHLFQPPGCHYDGRGCGLVLHLFPK